MYKNIDFGLSTCRGIVLKRSKKNLENYYEKKVYEIK